MLISGGNGAVVAPASLQEGRRADETPKAEVCPGGAEYELKYRGSNVSEWRRWERDWWDMCTLDVINVDVGGDFANATAPPAPAPLQAPSALGSRVLQLVEKHLNLGATHLGTPLAGADSLSFMALCRAVRCELQRELEPEVALHCGTVGELVQRVEEQPPARAAECCLRPRTARPGGASYAVYFAPSQWRGKCAWMYTADGLLDPECFHAAAHRLIARHEALHYTVLDPPELLPFLQLAGGLHVSLCPYLRKRLQSLPWPTPLRRAALRLLDAGNALLAFGLKGAYPRVGPKAGTHEAAVRTRHCRSWEEVLRGVQMQTREYEQPFSVALFLVEPMCPGDAPKSYVHFIVTHAFSDGFSCFPLINDLAELYEEELSRRACGAEARAASPPPPSAFGILQQRLFDALEVRPPSVAPEQVSLRTTEFYPALKPGGYEPAQYNHHVQFGAGAIAALRRYGREHYAAPLDLMLLGAIAGALLRTGVSDGNGKLTGEALGAQLLTFTLYAPMRDSAANEAMVGLFSDWREVSLPTCPGDGTTVLGLVLQLTSLVRARQWTKFDALQNSERILVNILALDERPRGACGFQQTRSHEYYWQERLAQPRTRSWRETALRPMRITLEQYEPSSWWLALDLADDCFPPAWCRRFVANLERTVVDLLQRPLTAVL